MQAKIDFSVDRHLDNIKLNICCGLWCVAVWSATLHGVTFGKTLP